MAGTSAAQRALIAIQRGDMTAAVRSLDAMTPGTRSRLAISAQQLAELATKPAPERAPKLRSRITKHNADSEIPLLSWSPLTVSLRDQATPQCGVVRLTDLQCDDVVVSVDFGFGHQFFRVVGRFASWVSLSPMRIEPDGLASDPKDEVWNFARAKAQYANVLISDGGGGRFVAMDYAGMPVFDPFAKPRQQLATKVQKLDNGCWQWVGRLDSKGYGALSWMGRGDKAHRVAYRLLVGEIPDGMTIDHLCHNADNSCLRDLACLHRRCVNPEHLEPVSLAENIKRRPPIGPARAAHCKRGHPFNEVNTYIRKDGRRLCRACSAASTRESRKRRG